MRSSRLRRARCAATAKSPNSTKLPGSQIDAMFSRAVRCPRSRRLRTASGRFSSSVWARRSRTSCKSGRMRSRSCASSAAACPAALPSARTATIGAPSIRVCPVWQRTSTTVPERGASITCSIFIASSTATTCPARMASPSDTATETTVACIGAETAALSSGSDTGMSSGASCPSAGASEGRNLPAASNNSPAYCAMKPVLTSLAATSGRAIRARSQGRFVSTPAIRNSAAARSALRRAAGKSAARECTISLASRLS